MSEFRPPQGINFHCQLPVPIASLSRDLCEIAGFLQSRFLILSLQRFEDWWQHDGLHFEREALDWHGLFDIVGSPRSLYGSMPGDDYVRIGIAPSDREWYLRFYADWDNEDEFLEGDYDITLPPGLAEEFREAVIPNLKARIQEEASQAYYGRIVL